MGLDKIPRRETEKKDEQRAGITPEEVEDYIDERTEYRNAYDAVLESRVVTDELTGIANRRGFVGELEKALQSMQQSLTPHSERRSERQSTLEEFSLLFIDLDNFKRVNDTLGHSAGDEALKRVAQILNKSVRKGSVTARFHGDEFAIFLPRVGEKEAEMVAQNVLQNLDNDPELKAFGVSASIGICHVDKSNMKESTAESLTDEADMLQIEAKQGGKGRFQVRRI